MFHKNVAFWGETRVIFASRAKKKAGEKTRSDAAAPQIDESEREKMNCWLNEHTKSEIERTTVSRKRKRVLLRTTTT